MLGINAPKVIAKGEYAQAVRKAALASVGAKAKKTEVPKKTYSDTSNGCLAYV